MDSSGMFNVHGEPFIDLYKRSLISCAERRRVEAEFSEVCLNFQAECNLQPVFVKDMAYHANQFLADEFICSVTNTFLIRHPKYSIPSLYRMRPDFDESQTGFEGQYALFNRIIDVTGKPAHVIDAEELKRNPETTISGYFQYIGFTMPKGVLTWKQGTRNDWAERESWHVDAINSVGFENKATIDPTEELPGRVLELIDRNLPYYEYLKQFTLTKTG